MQPDQTPVPPPTFGTMPGVVSHNSVYSSDSCIEDEAHHLHFKGEPLEGVTGWEDGEGGLHG